MWSLIKSSLGLSHLKIRNSPKHCITIIQFRDKSGLLWQSGNTLYFPKYYTIIKQSLLNLESSVMWVFLSYILVIAFLSFIKFPSFMDLHYVSVLVTQNECAMKIFIDCKIYYTTFVGNKSCII